MQVTTVDSRNLRAYYMMVLGLFMAILDIQIVASSIGELQAALSASMDEISWVQTSYLIAEVVMIPICGWISQVISTRILFSIAALMFTLSSAACAASNNFGMMIFFRVIQGFFCGAMIPSVFSAIYIIFPPEKQIKATVIAGLVATVAPTLGPTLGGWITTNFSWHWLFLVNIIPGIIVTYGVYVNLHIDEPKLELIKKFDYLGCLLIAIGLGLLEVFLKEGNRYDWFESRLIVWITVIMTVSFIWLLYHELKIEAPIVDFRAFYNVNFSLGCFLSFAIGVGLFGLVYLIPMLLSTVKNYDSLTIGIIMGVTGICQFMSGPIAGIAAKKMDLRMMLFLGLAMFTLGIFINSFMTTDVSFNELFWPQVLRGISIMFCFLPMTTITLSTLPEHEIKNASGLYNLMRNLGGAVGIAIIDTVLNHRIKIHKSYLAEFINMQKINQIFGDADVSNWVNYLADDNKLSLLNIKLIDLRISKQALILAFNDAFLYVGVYLLICCLFVFFIKPVKQNQVSFK